MSKALVVVTSVSKYPDMNRPTGLWLGEVVHFADVLYKNGYDIDYISPKVAIQLSILQVYKKI